MYKIQRKFDKNLQETPLPVMGGVRGGGRARYLDIAKGLGILCITFLHYEVGILPGPVNTFIGSFMISIFYLVAGWVLAMKDTYMPTKVLIRKRLVSLGLPYMYWTIIILTFDCILWSFGYYNSYFILREGYKSLVLRGIGTLWFLPALFIGEVCWNWLRNRSWVLWVIAFIFIWLYRIEYGAFFDGKDGNFWNIIKAPFYTINNGLGAIVYVAAGYFLFKVGKSPLRGLGGFIIGLMLCCLGYLSASYLSFGFGEASGYLWWLFAPILGPAGFILLFKSCQNLKIWNYFDYWGRNSLGLMVTHYSIIQVLLTIFITKVLNLEMWGWITIGAFVFSMPIEFFLVELIKRYWPWLLKPVRVGRD